MFNIITYCSKNYHIKLKRTINSWYNQDSVKNIFVYTDFLITQKSNKIIYQKLFEGSEDFGENCSRKVQCILHYFNNFITKDKQNDNILFLDIDCFIVKDISNLFDKDFYVGVTVYPEIKEKYKTNNISSGFIAIKNNVKSLDLILKWKKKQDLLSKESPCRDQKSLSESITSIKKDPSYKLLLLDSNVWNLHPSTGNIGHIKEWYKKIETNNPNILHFSSGAIDHQEIIDNALEACNVQKI